MELRQYWRIVYRRLWVVILLPVLVLGGSLLLAPSRAPLYETSMRFTMGLTPETWRGSYYAYDRYYVWLASEYLVDDFSQIVESQAFAQDVSRRLRDQGITLPTGRIQGSTVSQKQHRILTVKVTWHDQEQLQAIAQAAAKALEEDNSKYFAALGSEGALVYLIDPPQVVEISPSLKERLDIPIRGCLALIAGVGLAFFLDYIDDTIRDVAELEAMGMRVLAEIPSARSSWRAFRRARKG